MKRNITTFDGQISLFGEDESMSYPAVSRASRSHRREKEKEPMTTATSGQLCLQQSDRYIPDGSWARMFSELLIGMPGWYSNRCALTWRLKVTKSNRMYFQLAASTPRIADTEPSLLPTVTTTNARQGLNSTNNAGTPLLPMAAIMLKTPTAMDATIASGKKNPVSGNSGTLAQEIMSGFAMKRGLLSIPSLPKETMKFLPTPKASDGMGGTVRTMTGRTVTRPSGQTFSVGLKDLAGSGLLPTPITSHYKNGHRTLSPRIERKIEQGWTAGLNDLATLKLLPTPVAFLDGVYADKNPDKRHSKSIATLAYEAGGKTSQLNPLFVEEMMGFPNGWILSPFLKESHGQNEQAYSTDGGRNP